MFQVFYVNSNIYNILRMSHCFCSTVLEEKKVLGDHILLFLLQWLYAIGQIENIGIQPSVSYNYVYYTFINWGDNPSDKTSYELGSVWCKLKQNLIYHLNQRKSVGWWTLNNYCGIYSPNFLSVQRKWYFAKVWIFIFTQCTITLVNAILFGACLKKAYT